MSANDRMPIVGVVTVTYNSGSVLDDFLDSLAGQQKVEVRLYAVDNASTDTSVARLRSESRLDDLEVISNADNLGVAVGNNQGIEAALRDGCDWVLLLNNDTKIPPNAIHDLVATATENGLDILAPLIEATDPEDTVWFSGGRIRGASMTTRHLGVGVPLTRVERGLRQTGYASTCCLLVAPAVFGRVGLMDPQYFVYFDDVDFAMRALTAGYAYWLAGDTTIVHKASSLTGGKHSPFTLRWTSRNWPLLVRKNRSGFARFRGLGYIAVWIAGRLLLRRDSVEVFRLRIRGFREALALPLVSPPAAVAVHG